MRVSNPTSVPPVPQNENRRLRALRNIGILDSACEDLYDNITRVAASACETPISLISFVDADRQWFKARVGLEAQQTPRSDSFCAHAILGPDKVFVVPNALLDSRFANNPLVTGPPFVRFYAGALIASEGGLPLGTLCVIDSQPRHEYSKLSALLSTLADEVSLLLRMGESLKRLQEGMARLEIENRTDDLTGIGNRRGLKHTLKIEMARASRSREPLSVLVADVDLFKNYNDRYGHIAGDEVLMTLANLLQTSRRPFDYVARYGGEEFVMILPNTNSKDAAITAERFRCLIASHTWEKRQITVSVGVATSNAEAGSHTLISRADNALYRAKAAGRNCVACDGQP
jgi:diguanylate cyclase (GGDEF)-like protein